MNNYRIKKLIWNSGESYDKISEKMGVGTRAVGNWTRDANSPNADDLIKLSTYFGVSVDWILGLTDRKETNR
jgi:transcriptional regulator with XRE-family HTH domain